MPRQQIPHALNTQNMVNAISDNRTTDMLKN